MNDQTKKILALCDKFRADVQKIIDEGELVLNTGANQPDSNPTLSSEVVLNPYSPTSTVPVQIQTDDHILFTGTAPYLQYRFAWQIWDIADKMGIRLTVKNACRLAGEPIENPSHWSDQLNIVDLGYPENNILTLDLIHRLIVANVPENESYNEAITNDFRVTVTKEIKAIFLPWIEAWNARMQKLFLDKVMEDERHTDHMNVMFNVNLK
jgi:hypothetical protein